MKIFRNLMLPIFFVFTSCTVDKTDYEAELYAGASEYTVYKEVTSFTLANYKVSLEALNGNLYKGYNEIHLRIANSSGNAVTNISSVTFLPILSKNDGSVESCPHQYKLEYLTADKYFKGYATFQQKCSSCHSTALFTDNSFRNIGFPLSSLLDGNGNPEEGRMRVTGIKDDYMKFRTPSLRNVEFTAPYGSFGQFRTLKDVLDYFDNGVLYANNLDPILKNNGNRIPLTENEKTNLIAFLRTLSDKKFIGQ